MQVIAVKFSASARWKLTQQIHGKMLAISRGFI